MVLKNQLTILIIEDDDLLAKMYEKNLQLAGFKVLIADRGETGEELASSQKPDLVLLDIIMPTQDGFTTLINLRKDKEAKNIRIILLTKLGQEADVQKGKSLGANDYLVKSETNPSQLLEKIKKFLK